MLSSSGCGAENTPASRATWKSLGQTGIYLWAWGVIFCGGVFFFTPKVMFGPTVRCKLQLNGKPRGGPSKQTRQIELCHEKRSALVTRRRVMPSSSLRPSTPFRSISPSAALPSLASKEHNFIIVAVNTVIIKERRGERLPYYTFNENIADAHWVNIEF